MTKACGGSTSSTMQLSLIANNLDKHDCRLDRIRIEDLQPDIEFPLPRVTEFNQKFTLVALC